ncbi:MAG: carbon-nitrogen hydrolase family protein [Planctomycetota bacterium]|nr:MAG: carbon-nitrogen hydrolase family protein [Planctomycetota bacterium]
MACGKLKIATCQFAVGGSIKRNARQICIFLREAKKLKAEVVHLPECALSGYAGKDFKTLDEFNWQLLRNEMRTIMALTSELKLWVVLGSIHQLTTPNKPYNCLYLIDPKGKIVDRYDKRFCLSQELAFYTPGSRFVKFTINGVKCSLLICFDARFPELYRELYKKGVNCILQSFYNARQKKPSIHTHIMRQTMQCQAATNHFWVSMSNSSGYYSPYPSCIIAPDGKIVKQLKQNRPGIMTNTIDLSRKFYDPMADFRDMAIAGKLSNAPKTVKDPRSKDTKSL